MDADQFYDAEQRMLESDDPEEVSRGEHLLRERHTAHADDPLVQFLIASAFDGADREADAVIYYERALAIGVDKLPLARQPQLYLQAGSTLRNLGRLDEARILLTEGVAAFPGFGALVAFLALVEVSAGNDRQAVNHLLALL
ncbi:MAG: tetratricopeptide repeat protein, partial [Thermomicrobiales bacterium]